MDFEFIGSHLLSMEGVPLDIKLDKRNVGMKRKLAKIWKISILALALLIASGLIFPTWTPCIDGKNSISTLEQVEINGAGHEVMIRGTDRRNPIVIFVHGGQGVPKFLMWASIKKPSKRILRSYTMINAAAGKYERCGKIRTCAGSDRKRRGDHSKEFGPQIWRRCQIN